METLEWLAAGFCFALLGWLTSWLLLDSWRELRRAKLAADFAATYGTNPPVTAVPDEETWPIVAQQPQPSRHAAWSQESNPRAVTVPQLLAIAATSGDSLHLAWPPTDPDRAGLVQWNSGDDLPTGVLPVIRDDDS